MFLLLLTAPAPTCLQHSHNLGMVIWSTLVFLGAESLTKYCLWHAMHVLMDHLHGFRRVTIASMHQKKWRETKLQPSRARSDCQLSCCLDVINCIVRHLLQSSCTFQDPLSLVSFFQYRNICTRVATAGNLQILPSFHRSGFGRMKSDYQRKSGTLGGGCQVCRGVKVAEEEGGIYK